MSPVVKCVLAFALMAVLAFITTATDSRSFLYEIQTRSWLYGLSQKYGKPIKLNTIPNEEFIAIAKMGVNVIWMMGVWQLGNYGIYFDRVLPQSRREIAQSLKDFQLADIIGSPYAVQSYIPNPDIAPNGESDLAALRDQLHSLGLSLCLDFVPNHSAVDAPEVTLKQNLYVLAPTSDQTPYDPEKYLPNGVAMGKDPYFDPWKDTAQFNYFNQDTRSFCLNNLMTVAKYADWIRCDMAMLLLNDVFDQTWGNIVRSRGYNRPGSEFWSDAIRQLKSRFPQVKLMAEVYWNKEKQMQQLGFDYTYDKEFYDQLREKNHDEIRGFIQNLARDPYYLEHSVHFLENHDEVRSMAAFGFEEKAKAAALMSLTLPGVRFYHHGEWEGLRTRMSIKARRPQNESVNDRMKKFYNTVTPAIFYNSAFQNGTWSYLWPNSESFTSSNLFAWKWVSGNQKFLCIINFSGSQGQGNIILRDAQSPTGSDTYTITDILTGQNFDRSANEMRTRGLGVLLRGWEGQIFKY